MNSGAILSKCGQYRYSLWRNWGGEKPPAAFVMLNPSTADAEKDDPTIRRCIGFAKSWGASGILVLNLFAYRATDPNQLAVALDPVGPENDDYLRGLISLGFPTVAAWGTGGVIRGRGREVRRMFEVEGQPLLVLRTTKHGDPAHPLYLPATLKPMPWRAA